MYFMKIIFKYNENYFHISDFITNIRLCQYFPQYFLKIFENSYIYVENSRKICFSSPFKFENFFHFFANSLSNAFQMQISFIYTLFTFQL